MLCTFQHRCVQAFYDAQHTVFISHCTLFDYYVVQSFCEAFVYLVTILCEVSCDSKIVKEP
jgi:hypothetical protein